MKRRILSILLTICMLVSMFPTEVWAAESYDGGLCPHHTEHNEDCDYIAASEGDPCGFFCEICAGMTKEIEVMEDSEAMGNTITPSDTVEAPAITVEEVQALIDELPTVEAMAEMDEDGQRMAYNQTQAGYDAYMELTEEQQTEISGLDNIYALFEFFNGMITSLADITLNIANGDIIITDTGYTQGDTTVSNTDNTYTITGSSQKATITINVTSTLNLTFDNLSMTGEISNSGYGCGFYINGGNVAVTLVGTNTIEATQDGTASGAVTIASGAELHFKGNGNIKIHGSSVYGAGGDAVSGGNLYIEGGTVTLVGGNRISGSYGKSFNGDFITVNGGTLNYYQGELDATSTGSVSAEDAVFESGAINGKTYSSDTTPIPTVKDALCTSVTLETADNAAYKMDSKSWQDSPTFTGLEPGSIHTFYQHIKIDDYFSLKASEGRTITLPEHEISGWFGNGNGTHTGTCTICKEEKIENCSGGTASYFQKAVCTVCKAPYGAFLPDNTPPTGEICLGQNTWQSFLNTITFGLFFQNTQIVTITATDDSYAVTGYTEEQSVTIEYYLYHGDEELTIEELNNIAFSSYDSEISIQKDDKYIVYAKLTDWAENVTYVSSEGIVIYSNAEAIDTAITYIKTTKEDKTVGVNLNGNTINEIKCHDTVLVPGTDYTVDDGIITFKGDWLDILTVGEYTLTLSYNPQGEMYVDATGNDAPDTTTITLVVNKADQDELKITEKPIGTITYGDSFTLSTTGGTGTGAVTWSVTEGSSYATINGNTGEVTIIGVGQVTITAAKADDDNYSAVSDTYTFTVERKKVTPTALTGDFGRPYNGTTEVGGHHDLGIELEGVVNGDGWNDVHAEGNYALETPDAGENKTVIATNIVLYGEKAANYVLTTDTATGDVAMIIPAELYINKQSFTYNGGTAFTVDLEGVEVDGKREIVTATLNTASKNAASYGYATEAAEGKYTVTIDNSNYIVNGGDTLAIGPLMAQITWNDPLTFTYNGQSHEVTAYVANAITGDQFSLSYEDNKETGVGNYTAKVTGLGNTNYTLPDEEARTQSWNIMAANSTVTLTGADTTYGETVTLTATITKPDTSSNSIMFMSVAQDTVDFYVNGAFVGTKTVTYDSDAKDSGTATLTIPAIAANNFKAGANNVTVEYGGSTNLKSGNGAAMVHLAQRALMAEIIGTTSKIYDGTTTAGGDDGLSIMLKDVMSGDTVTATATYTYDNANVGEAKTIKATDITLDGAEAGNYTVNKTAEAAVGTISAKEVTEPDITLTSTSYVYDGNEKKPDVVVKDGDTVIPTSEYTVTYSNNVNVGTSATVTITDNEGGNYIVSGTVSFTITPLTASIVWNEPLTFTYDSSEKTVTAYVENKQGDDTDDDFMLVYEGNKETGVGNYTAKVTGLGNTNYTLPDEAARTQSWSITAVNSTVTLTGVDTTYGETVTLTATITKPDTSSNSIMLMSVAQDTVDFYVNGVFVGTEAVTYDSNAKDSGTATLTIPAIAANNFKAGANEVTCEYGGSINLTNGDTATTVTIAKKELIAKIDGTTSKIYDATTATSDDLTITLDGVEDCDSDEVTVTATDGYAYDSANVGDRTITASGIKLIGDKAGNYTVSEVATTNGTITKSSPTIAFKEDYDPSKAYDKEMITDPTEANWTITGVTDGKVSVIWSDTPVNAGEYTVTITLAGTDNAEGSTATKTVTISPKEVTDSTITLSPDSFVYDGSAKEPAVQVKDGNDVISASEYEISYSNNTNVGTATVTITDNEGGNYTVSGTATFAITEATLAAPNVLIHYIDETLVNMGDDTREIEFTDDLDGEWLPFVNGMSIVEYEWDQVENDIYIRYVEDNNHISDILTLTIPARPDIPTDKIKVIKTDTTISITNTDEHENLEYSIDGESWNEHGEFTNLDAGTTYTLYMRSKAVDPVFGSAIITLALTAEEEEETGAFASESKTKDVTTLDEDGSTVLKPDETVGTENGSVTNNGDNITFEDEDGKPGTTITPPTGENFEDGVNVDGDGNITVPDGSTVRPGNGGPDITVGENNNGEATVAPDGSVTLPGSGSADIGDVTVTMPEEGGTITSNEDGTVNLPGGTTVEKGGETITIPEEGGFYDPEVGETYFYYYTITIDRQDGSDVETVKVAYGDTLTKPTDPTRVGYIFGGWYTDAACTSVYDFSTPITGELTLYAKWTKEAGPTQEPSPSEPDDPTNPDEPTNPDNPDEPTNPDDSTNPDSTLEVNDVPKTGDESNIALWIMLFVLSCFVSCQKLLLLQSKKQRNF